MARLAAPLAEEEGAPAPARALARLGAGAAALCVAFALSGTAEAAEGGGFYLLGSRTELAGVVPPPGVYGSLDVYGYSGSASGRLPVAGRLEVGLDADVVLALPTVLWSIPTVLPTGARPFVGLTAPVGWKRISTEATLSRPSGEPLRADAREDDTLFGDPVPTAGLGWSAGPVFGAAIVSVNVPVGDYDRGRTTNIAFNRWGVDLTGALTWLDPSRGWQASLAAGVTLNGENPDTDYRTGTELHVEGSVTRMVAPGLSVGLHGYHYRQVTGDSGDGAVLGDFKGRASALGPGLTWTVGVGETPVSIKARWLHEFGVENRLEGDAIFLGASIPFGG